MYSIPDVGTNSLFVLTNGNYTINGVITFTTTPVFPAQGFTSIELTNTSNQITLGTIQTIVLTAPTPAASVTYTIPDEAADATFVLTPSATPITITPTHDQIVLGTTNTVTINASEPSGSRTYTIPDTGANSNFVMTEGNQTIAASNTFTGDVYFQLEPQIAGVILTNTSDQLIFGSSPIIIITAPAPSSTRTYTIRDEAETAAFVLTPSAFPITIAPSGSAANQLVLGGGGSPHTITLNAPSPSVSRIYTIPDSGANSSFILSDSAQTLTGQITFSNSILLATSGGVPTALNYYEEYFSGTLTFSCGSLVAGSTTVGYAIVKIGKIVNFSLPAFSGTSKSTGSPDFFHESGTPLIPTRFYAAQSVNETIDVLFSGASSALGTFNMVLSGSLTITISASSIVSSVVELQASFPTDGNQIGWNEISLSWITN